MNRGQVLEEWRRAVESFGAAASCRRDGFYADSVSRSYYAMLHVAKAALQLQAIAAESHAAVRRLFGYDKDLPEIPDRLPHLPPMSHLRKKEKTKDEFEIVEGRRPSKLLLVNRLREAVGEWRDAGYRPGASPVTERLFTYWFDEDHLVGDRAFRYYFGQREAVETLIYLVELQRIRDAKVLEYVVERCFGGVIDLEDDKVRSHLQYPLVQDGIGRYLARQIGELITEKRTIEFENASFKLSETSEGARHKRCAPEEAR